MPTNVGATPPKRKRIKRATVKRKQVTSVTRRRDGGAEVFDVADTELVEKLVRWLAEEPSTVWRHKNGLIVTEAWGVRVWGTA